MERSRDTGSSSRAEGTRSPRRDEFRRRAESSRRNDAELSDQLVKRPSLDEITLDEIKTASAEVRAELYTQAIEKGRAKMQKYRQEAERYQNKERNTFEEFKRKFASVINSENYVVEVKSTNSYGEYENEIDVKNGRIIGGINRCNNPDSKERLDFSEVVFNQLQLAMKHLKKEISEFDLKCWYGDTITNEETINTAKLFFPEERDVDGSVKEGEKTFLAGTDAFMALAGTPTAQSKFYLLAQHPKVFKDKKVTSITVIRQVYSILDINYEFGS